MFGDVFLFERDGAPPTRAERLAFGETSGRNEAWLRDTLFDNPDLLPVGDIDPTYGPLIPLCKELQTDAGRLDIAFINQFGRLTLVECKLWRNPESRRKVVAQVLDYARAISRWTYSDLQRQVSAALGRTDATPFDLVSAKVPGIKEQQFVDSVYKAIRSGHFLLLIAGDGIREDVGAMTEFIDRNAASNFSFGLIEVALYGFEDGSLAIQPRAIARTQIIERTVVVVRDQVPGQPAAVIDATEAEGESASIGQGDSANALGESAKQAEYRAWWQPVLEIKFDDPDQEAPKLFWPNNVRAALPWPQTWILVFRVGGDSGKIGVCIAGRTAAYVELISALTPIKDEIVAALPSGSDYQKFNSGNGYTFNISRNAADFESESEKRDWLKSVLNSYVNVLRPRIKGLMLTNRT